MVVVWHLHYPEGMLAIAASMSSNASVCSALGGFCALDKQATDLAVGR